MMIIATEVRHFCHPEHPSMPRDSIEPLRRMVKWIVDEISNPASVPAPWIDRRNGVASMADA